MKKLIIKRRNVICEQMMRTVLSAEHTSAYYGRKNTGGTVMGFVDERRKVVITLEEGIWEFKALDGSVISKPENADEELTAALSETAKQQELVSGTGTAKLTVDGKDYDLEIERILDLRVGDVLEETAKLYPDQEALISFDGTRRIDYRTFDEDSKAFAKYLQHRYQKRRLYRFVDGERYRISDGSLCDQQDRRGHDRFYTVRKAGQNGGTRKAFSGFHVYSLSWCKSA